MGGRFADGNILGQPLLHDGRSAQAYADIDPVGYCPDSSDCNPTFLPGADTGGHWRCGNRHISAVLPIAVLSADIDRHSHKMQ